MRAARLGALAHPLPARGVSYLVTGLVTATGGAWNASIVAEYVRYRGLRTLRRGKYRRK